jgi:SNF2 family DNA or RNA helicase
VPAVAERTVARKSMEPELKDSVIYYPHQIDGIRKLMKLRNFILADDMGLGKSLQALTVFIGDIKMGARGVGLIVCPISLKDNWADEIEKFTRIKYMILGKEMSARTGRLKEVTAARRTEQVAEFAGWDTPKILITHYEQVKAHIHELNALNIRAAIFDEAHYMKNPESARSQACASLISDRSFMLTGTPILNNVSELWPLLNKISPKKFSNPKSFDNRYVVFGGHKGKQRIGTKNVAELTAILQQVMLRRLKKDVLNIPQPYYVRINVDLHPEQRRLYDRIELEEKLESLDPNGEDAVMDNALVSFLRMKQICDTPACLGFEDKSYKMDMITDRIVEQNENGEKVVVFTQFRPVLDLLESRLQARNQKAIQLSGEVKAGDRVPLVKYWGAMDGPVNLLCMSQVAGVGLNMTKSRVAMFVDKLFVPGLNQQCVDRIHRIGASETQPVQVFEFITKNTIEHRVEQILKSKKITQEVVVEGASRNAELMRTLLRELRKGT